MTTTKSEAYENGKQARRDNKPIESCPYTTKSRLGQAWRAGWYWIDSKMYDKIMD